MNIAGVIIEALESLNANKMRSALTVLGIIIGVGAVIAMLSLGEGVQADITGQISDVGSNLIFVMSGSVDEELTNIQPLTTSDVDALLDPFLAPSVAEAVPVVQGSIETACGGETTRPTVTGTTPGYQAARSADVSEGEFITEDHVLGVSSVAVIGTDVADDLFGRRDGIVGETIRLDGQPFRVIGVLKAKGGSAMGSEDNVVIVPLTSAQRRLFNRPNHNQVDLIYVQAVSSDLVQTAKDEVIEVLRNEHRIRFGSPDDFTIFTQESILNMANTITNTMVIFLGGVAAISLLVGGIGIMNIMLVSVTERTREIGLRKALGAKKRHILVQFLTESALLSMIGGIIGIILGFSLALVVSKIAAVAGTPIRPVFGLGSILLATLFSAAVGIFFGIYPANRAASLQPVEALRHE